MNQTNHRVYYAARANKSRELAILAQSPYIAAIHVELAERYDFLAAQPELVDPGYSAELVRAARRNFDAELSSVDQRS